MNIVLTADKEVLNPVLVKDDKAKISVQVFDNDKDVTKDANITYTATDVLYSMDLTVAHVTDDGVVIPENGGMTKITATVEYNGETSQADIDILIRPFKHEYHKTLTLKLFMGFENKLYATFEDALEIIKKLDNATRGAKKIVYLIGWQFGGHDTGYPSWAIVNHDLKREQDEKSEDSLRWLIREARQYNTVVSLHINMLDAHPNSILWDEYIEKDLIARELDGSITEYEWGNMLSYTAEWKAGLSTRRIDQLLNMLPELVESGTIHIDAFHSQNTDYPDQPISKYHEAKFGYGIKEEAKTQQKIFKYWREKGLDVTCEYSKNCRIDRFLGLQPMAWHMDPITPQEELEIPASLLCGGDEGVDVFGQGMLAEGVIRHDKENLTGIKEEFCLIGVPFLFLNSFDRLDYDDEKTMVTFSDGVISYKKDDKLYIEQNGKLFRDGDNVFLPAVWKDKEIIAYSKEGYTDREWQLPDNFDGVEAVDIYTIGIKEPELTKENVKVNDGKITLALDKDQAVSIVPAGVGIK